MEISELKQPYRRMAEYLAGSNKKVLNNAFSWAYTDYHFWDKVNDGNYPPITKSLKRYFPADFDFSGEEVEVSNNTKNITISEEVLFNLILDAHSEITKMGPTGMVSKSEVILSKIDEVLKLNKEYYTQLVKEGKFDNLPDTCEFSEAVELEVWDRVKRDNLRRVIGKFKGKFVTLSPKKIDEYSVWNFAQLPTPKIDFSEFKPGDVVEVELLDNSTRIGWFNLVTPDILRIKIAKGPDVSGDEGFNINKIRNIIKIK